MTEGILYEAHRAESSDRGGLWFSATLAGAMLVFVLLADELTWFTITFLLVCAASLLYSALYRPRKQFVRYELGRYELIIHSDQGERIVPYDAIKGLTVQHFWEKPMALDGVLFHGYAYGMFRLAGYEVSLYATRRDRIVLLDTVEGLIGLTPAAAVEDHFLAELKARSHAVRALDGYVLPAGSTKNGIGFVPQHAKKSVAIWPIVVFGMVLNMLVAALEDKFAANDSFWFDASSIVFVLAIATLYRPLFRLHKLQPWLFPVLSVILSVILFVM